VSFFRSFFLTKKEINKTLDPWSSQGRQKNIFIMRNCYVMYKKLKKPRN